MKCINLATFSADPAAMYVAIRDSAIAAGNVIRSDPHALGEIFSLNDIVFGLWNEGSEMVSLPLKGAQVLERAAQGAVVACFNNDNPRRPVPGAVSIVALYFPDAEAAANCAAKFGQ
jgi:hypothetical protein